MLQGKEGTNFFELEFAILFCSPLLIKSKLNQQRKENWNTFMCTT
jgi:hypothetical protein